MSSTASIGRGTLRENSEDRAIKLRCEVNRIKQERTTVHCTTIRDCGCRTFNIQFILHTVAEPESNLKSEGGL